jgi:DNA-binding GntR family transcriptional regulator
VESILYICPLNTQIRERMGHKSKEFILKSKLKYAILDKETNKVTILYTQKAVTTLFNVSRRTIYRGLPIQNDRYIVYNITNVP